MTHTVALMIMKEWGIIFVRCFHKRKSKHPYCLASTLRSPLPGQVRAEEAGFH